MAKLQNIEAKRCLTSAGILIQDKRVLLIKHKKLGVWMPPGGHVDENELPHRAAEREFWEETGVKVKAESSGVKIKGEDTEYLPSPFAVNLHWISQENYKKRIDSKDKNKYIKSKTWPRGCEQHYTLVYLVKPVDDVDFKKNVEETDGIDWFGESELDDLEISEDIKNELSLCLTT